MANKAHHRGAHHRLGTPAVAAANADPSYRCPYCGLTLDQGRKAWGEQGEWERAHKVAGRIARRASEYEAWHAHCNRSDGQRHGTRLRSNPHSRRW